jgi:hypothetical protein
LFRVPIELGGPNWTLECIGLKGETHPVVERNPNQTQNPIATIRIENVTTQDVIRIDVVFSNARFPVSGGDCIPLIGDHT